MSRGLSNIIESHTSHPAALSTSSVSSSVSSGRTVSPFSTSCSTSGVAGRSGLIPVVPVFSRGTTYSVEQLRKRKPGMFFVFNL